MPIYCLYIAYILPRDCRGCAALMSRSQPKIWQKIQKIGGDISPASLAFRKYAPQDQKTLVKMGVVQFQQTNYLFEKLL